MIQFIFGLLLGAYIIIGLVNMALYILSTSIVSMGYVNTEDAFKHFIAWPIYRYWQ